MQKNGDDTDLVLMVAGGAGLVATGTAVGGTQPLIGFAILAVAVTLLIYALVRMARRQKAQDGKDAPRRSDVWILAAVIGMMLSGGGAALAVVLDPAVGLGIALGGGVLCGIGGWRMIVGQQ